jgi:hypothetical protein
MPSSRTVTSPVNSGSFQTVMRKTSERPIKYPEDGEEAHGAGLAARS